MPEKVEYYLSKGFDRKAAEYYASGRHKIVGVIANDDFSLALTFDNGEKRRYDMKPSIEDETVFKPLMDKAVFQRVYLDEYGAVSWDIDPTLEGRKVWNNKIDLCPDSCYIDSIPM